MLGNSIQISFLRSLPVFHRSTSIGQVPVDNRILRSLADCTAVPITRLLIVPNSVLQISDLLSGHPARVLFQNLPQNRGSFVELFLLLQ